MSFTLTFGQEGNCATAQVVWSVDGKTYNFRSDNNFVAWISTIFTVADSLGSVNDYRLLRPYPATQDTTLGLNGNTAGGRSALISNTTGTNNTAFGAQALRQTQSGEHNTACGTNCLLNNVAGSFNSALGEDALLTNNANNNTAIGYHALRANQTGVNNTAVGQSSLLACDSFNNTAVGQGSLYQSISGNSNCAIGLNAGGAILSGSSNTLLGTQTDVDSGVRSLCVVIGKSATSPAVDGSLSIGGTGANAMGNLVSATSGGASGQHLRIYLNGVQYKINLFNP
jgi:hypothetical protein